MRTPSSRRLVFIRREDARNVLSRKCPGDDLEITANRRIEERELEGFGSPT
jgi:hypothetical protein